ncbi:MAG: TIGR04255 family protein [Candidatus Auribacterota bacterium]
MHEIYPNSPLIEVVFEIRFNPNFRIKTQLDQFYEQISAEYNSILFPNMEVGQIIGNERYRFEKKDHSAGILIALDRIAYYCRDYQGHKVFISEALKILDLFHSTFRIAKLTRLGWRYINLIPFIREDGSIPLERFFTLKLTLPSEIDGKLNNLNTIFILDIKGGQITTKIEPIMNEDSKEAIVLDFDYSKIDGLDFSNISGEISNAHKQTRQLFELLITPEYRSYLRGEGV